MIVMIDNYDSFTWNLVQQIERIAAEPMEVIRNDQFDVGQLLASKPEAIVISPGPGRPSSAGGIVELVRRCAEVPLLGVCLGHQAIGEAFGGEVVRGPQPVHGKITDVTHGGSGLFEGCPAPMKTARYHSLVVDREKFPPELQIEAEAADGSVMALRHRQRLMFGIQFHPESYGTPDGDVIVKNFLRIAKERLQ